MTRRAWFAIILAAPALAGIVDRIAVTVANRVITASDVETRLRLSAFQNGEQPDFALAARRAAVQLLIDQRLIEREMKVGHYPQLGAEERTRLVPTFAASGYNSSVTVLEQALAGARLTRQDLEDDLARQFELITFLNLRFRPAVQVSDEEVERYYRERGTEQAPLAEARPAIEQRIATERADRELENWLAEQRRRTRIVFVEADLRGVAK